MKLFTATETTTIYKQTNNTGLYYTRLQIGQTADILEELSGNFWLKATAKGYTGYIERKRGTVTGDDTYPPPPTPIPQTDLVYITGYFDVFGMDYVSRKALLEDREQQLASVYGLPAAIKLGTTKRIDISPDTLTRKLWLELFKTNAPAWLRTPENKGYLEKRFVGLLKNGVCYTDSAGNTGFNQIETANNIAHSMGSPTRLGGVVRHPIRVLKIGTYGAMLEQIHKYPYIVSKATISTRGLEGREVIPFWHLDGNTVPVPQFCIDEVNWIPEEFVRPIPEGDPLPNGYFPERFI